MYTSINLRRAVVDDAATVLAWMNDERIWRMDNPAPYQPRALPEFEKQWARMVGEQTVWMLEVQDEPVGHMGWVHQGSTVAEFYIVIGEPDRWGEGLGREAMQMMVDAGLRDRLHVLYGRVLGENQRARSFFASLGFRDLYVSADFYERDGRSHDLYWVALDLHKAAA